MMPVGAGEFLKRVATASPTILSTHEKGWPVPVKTNVQSPRRRARSRFFAHARPTTCAALHGMPVLWTPVVESIRITVPLARSAVVMTGGGAAQCLGPDAVAGPASSARTADAAATTVVPTGKLPLTETSMTVGEAGLARDGTPAPVGDVVPPASPRTPCRCG